MSRRTALQRKERGQYPLKGLDLAQPPGLVEQLHPLATVSKAPANVKTQTDASENRPPPLEDAPVCKRTPWTRAGKMSQNLFEDRNWLLPPNYLNNDSKNATGIISPPPHKRRT